MRPVRSGNTSRRRARFRRQRGQVALFLMMVLVILTFLFLWNVDLHRILNTKSGMQNAGDAAALAAARWQGSALNLVGELNVMHALALCETNDAIRIPVEAAIVDIQARLNLSGPMTAFLAAQEAAQINGAAREPAFERILNDHITDVESLIGTADSEAMEPFPGAMAGYVSMLRSVVNNGIYAAPENARFFGIPSGGHTLLTQQFYLAITGSWCWFHPQRGAYYSLLQNYTSYHSWPPLPDIEIPTWDNCEIYGLGTLRSVNTLRMAIDRDIIEREVEQQLTTPMYGTNAWDLAASFYFYKSDVWHTWNAFHELGATLFTGPLKPEYDYAGADVAVRVHGYVSRIMPRNDSTTSNRITWTAAARPMGYLEMDADTREPPHTYGFVLPAFRDVRLIAIDTASNANQSLFDPEWWYHAYAGSLSGQSHVQEYLRSGPRADNGCPYCEALVQWEDPAFRQQILDWLDEYGYLCTLRPPGGRAGGGTQRGH